LIQGMPKTFEQQCNINMQLASHYQHTANNAYSY